ncbi:hypothetical protein MKW94_019975 [Papaver nudicaule]|uniref:60S acidic ribosomal protein P1 n=1 Tax=Papaver nudicaule TaxID=74823 RepID=A0AA41UWD6_PAPNU|nr:hypothetical protein [Papaver nudicaule]
MSSGGEIACTYATLIPHDDIIPCESYWPSLFAKLVEKRNVEDLITNIGSGGGGASVAVSAPLGGGGAEAKEETDDDMEFSLFD